MQHCTSARPWRIWIDTGGTFTDCLAVGPDDEIGHYEQYRRAKVLSSGALRGLVARQLDERRFLIRQNWNAGDDLIRGFEFALLGQPNAETARVARFDAGQSVLELATPWIGEIAGQSAFEVRGDEPAPILAARLVTQTPAGVDLPPIHMRLATTRGTNALLERKGAATALFITEGFGDLLLIGDQQRPDLFALRIEKTPPLHSVAIEVRERISAAAMVLREVDLVRLAADARRALGQGIDAAAVALMNSHANPEHEQKVADLLRKVGFKQVAMSSQLAAMIRLLPRAQTAVVEAYLGPIIENYLDVVQRLLGSTGALHAMTSAGGLVRAESFHACDSLLSGPAGGVAGAAAAGKMSGYSKIIGFDMGGTSTDVARYDGDFEYRFEHAVAGVRLMTPSLAIETVAAGGGSICDCVDDRLVVGPQSAAACPGPACYGSGGPLTLTDVNLLLGRLDGERFELPIDRRAAELAADSLREKLAHARAKPHAAAPELILSGLLEIANERMAAAIERISLRQGFDPRDYALVAFGGAGGQHACAVAERLGIGSIIMPADASLLSALGLGHSAIERLAQRQVLKTLADCARDVPDWIAELSARATSEIESEGVPREAVAVRRVVANMRVLGQDAPLAIDVAAIRVSGWRHLFAERYRAVFGHEIPPEHEKPIEVESIRVVAFSKVAEPSTSFAAPHPARRTKEPRRVRSCFDGHWQEVAAFERPLLSCGQRFDGPALVLDRRSTCVIEPGWSGEVDAAGAVVVRRDITRRTARRTQPEAVELELFTNRFSAIADEMGQMLHRTALSTNVKERLDFSCALLNADGELVVNAPHIPVHLGAIGMCVRAVRGTIEIGDGDVIVTNHPAFGGSHLPDITVITPVFFERGLLGYVANRAHHAEIGGTRPGSMPPAAKTLIEEGVVIRPQYLLQRNVSRFGEIEAVLGGGPHPSRAVRDNLADLRAAVAANQRGATALQKLARDHGVDVINRQMKAMTDRAGRLTRAALARLPRRKYEAIERLDDGSPIHVTIEVRGDSAIIDFAGSAPVHPGNLNATPAIVRSAVIYVLRLLIGEQLPLNEGIMRAVQVEIPHGMLNPDFCDDASKCPAVVGGNTETSQRVVDALLKALNLAACSQGTMNNVLFGNEWFGYYETVCGGSGAGPGFHGADSVHTHMTNTRITDPEIIEHRYPVRLEKFAIRRGSGGAGQWSGGNGTIREIAFLQPMSLSILSQHRIKRPYGLEGGESGCPGRQRVIRPDGGAVELHSIDGCEVGPGDRLVLETPGGGGYGPC